MAMQPKGRGTQTNISDWQAYAKRNSFDQTESTPSASESWRTNLRLVQERLPGAPETGGGQRLAALVRSESAQQLHRQGWQQARLMRDERRAARPASSRPSKTRFAYAGRRNARLRGLYQGIQALAGHEGYKSQPWLSASQLRQQITPVATLGSTPLSTWCQVTLLRGAKLPCLTSLVLYRRRRPMKALVSILALSLVVAFTAPAFAGAPKTEAACKKAGKMWDAATKKCS